MLAVEDGILLILIQCNASRTKTWPGIIQNIKNGALLNETISSMQTYEGRETNKRIFKKNKN